MLTLVIETSTERGVIGIVDCTNKTILAEDQLPYGYQNSRFLLPRLESLFNSLELKPANLAFVTVGRGPGSYTGMRVGAVVAKTLSYACKLPLVGIQSLAGFAPSTDCRFAAMVDAKIGGIYVSAGQKKLEQIHHNEPFVCTLGQLPQHMKGISCIVSPHTEQLKKRFDTDCEWIEKGPDVLRMGLLGREGYEAGQFSLDGSLEFLYLRKTQVEIEQEKG